MKLHPSNNQHYQTVTAYDSESVTINGSRFTSSLVVMPELAPQAWNVSQFDALQPADFEALADLGLDVLILGTGARQRFIHPKLSAVLLQRGIGVESMDSHAACRTYNLLMNEGRKVALALIIDPA